MFTTIWSDLPTGNLDGPAADHHAARLLHLLRRVRRRRVHAGRGSVRNGTEAVAARVDKRIQRYVITIRHAQWRVRCQPRVPCVTAQLAFKKPAKGFVSVSVGRVKQIWVSAGMPSDALIVLRASVVHGTRDAHHTHHTTLHVRAIAS